MMTAWPSIGLSQHGTELLMDGSKVAAIPCGRPTIAQSNRQLIGLRPGFTSSIRRQRIHLNRTAYFGPWFSPAVSEEERKALHEKFPTNYGYGVWI